MVDVSNGIGTSFINAKTENPSIGSRKRGQSVATTTGTPLPLYSAKQPSHAAVARFHPRVRRRLGRNTTFIMRTLLGALGLASVCLFWVSRGPPQTYSSRRVASLTVQLVQDHEPMRAGPLDNETTKYFHEPAGHEPGDDELLGHYDIRYYTGKKVSYDERTDTLHHMIRAYLTSLRELNVETWIAHGTLLGWWWNGQILPWDWDLDVQVTGETLQYMGKWLNGTVHSYKSGDVERHYLLDVNPHSAERVNGDGMNIIDARWIDVRNGLFIDITGISEIQPEMPKVWSCKNYHDYNEWDIWPLKESFFEGVPALVPKNYDRVLAKEYTENAFKSTEFEGHHWDPELEKWIADKTLPKSQTQSQDPLAEEDQHKKDDSPSSDFETQDDTLKADKTIKSFEDFEMKQSVKN